MWTDKKLHSIIGKNTKEEMVDMFYIIILAIIIFAILEVPVVPVLIGVGVVIAIGVILLICKSSADVAADKAAAERRAKENAEARRRREEEAKRQAEEKAKVLAGEVDAAIKDPDRYGRKYFHSGWYKEAIPLLNLVMEKGNDWESEAGKSAYGTCKAMMARSLVKQGEKDRAKELWRTFKRGDLLQWGSYPQKSDNDSLQPIQWIVLGFQGDDLLLLSSSVLDAHACISVGDKVLKTLDDVTDLEEWSERYPDEAKQLMARWDKGTTWDNSDLRNWLNGKFWEKAFSDGTEQEMIPCAEIYTHRNEEYDTYGGTTCRDKVFVLSTDEAKKYLPEEEGRTERAVEEDGTVVYKMSGGYAWGFETGYARKQGLLGTVVVPWWLRTPGEKKLTFAYVYGGKIVMSGLNSLQKDVGVRPAIRLRLE
jgi:hypothetical protein